MASEQNFRPRSWTELLRLGFEPGDYPYEGLPIGARRVALDATLWHPDRPGVVCFFRDFDSGQRYRVTAFRNLKTRKYGPQGVDFSRLGPGTILTIEIRQNRTGTFRIENAEISMVSLAGCGMEPEP